jgi:sulfite reductase alpha subunit-like flavoprotein
VSWKGPNNETRYGLASSYYQNLHNIYKLDSCFSRKYLTKIIIRDSSFRLPSSPDVPMILCATGTGIAPYIGFLQELEHKKKLGETFNKVFLYFGTKNKNFDFIFEEELTNWLNQGIIDKLFLAFSRDQEKKLYIQNLIKDSFEEIKDKYEKGNIYVCGGVSMGHAVNIELENLLHKEFIQKLDIESRYIKEFWGK